MRYVLGLILAVLGTPALAGLTFCNDSGGAVRVAIGYSDAGTWTSEGWWTIEAHDCKTVEGGELDKRFYYYRAMGDGMNWAKEEYYFCTGPSPFTIAGDTDCAERGFERAAFNEIELAEGVTDFTMTLTAPAAAPATRPAAPRVPKSVVHGLLSHCEVTDAGTQCEMHDDWTRYISYIGQSDDSRLHTALMDLPPNTPVVWEGYIEVADAGYAEINLTGAEQAGFDPMAETRAGVQGAWVSDDDPNYLLIINGGVFEEWYQGVPTETAMFDIGRSCPGARGEGLYLQARAFGGEAEPRCFSVEYFDGHTLELWPVGAMRMLSFSANGM